MEGQEGWEADVEVVVKTNLQDSSHYGTGEDLDHQVEPPSGDMRHRLGSGTNEFGFQRRAGALFLNIPASDG